MEPDGAGWSRLSNPRVSLKASPKLRWSRRWSRMEPDTNPCVSLKASSKFRRSRIWSQQDLTQILGDSAQEPACAAVSRVEGAKVTSKSRRDPLQIVWGTA